MLIGRNRAKGTDQGLIQKKVLSKKEHYEYMENDTKLIALGGIVEDNREVRKPPRNFTEKEKYHIYNILENAIVSDGRASNKKKPLAVRMYQCLVYLN